MTELKPYISLPDHYPDLFQKEETRARNENNNNNGQMKIVLTPTTRRKHKKTSSDSTILFPEKPLPKPLKRLMDFTAPDAHLLNAAAAKYLHSKMTPGPSFDELTYSVFDEFYHPVDCYDIDSAPRMKDIYLFLEMIQRIGQLDPVSVVLAIHYLDQVLENDSVEFCPRTWKRLLIGCLILGCKVYEDLSVCLEDFQSQTRLPFLSIHSLNLIEIELLALLNYHIPWGDKEYTQTILKLGLSLK